MNSLAELPSDWRGCFADAAARFVELAAAAQPRIEGLGLGEWTIRDLVGHTSRSLITVVDYLGAAGPIELDTAAMEPKSVIRTLERRPVEGQIQQEQASPELQARIHASFERQGLMSHLGARIVHIAPGRVHIVLPGRREVTQQHGFFHAGATSAIADSAGGYAAFTLFPDNTSVLTVEYKINLLAPAVGDHLEAVGTVLKSGRTLTVCQLEVLAIQDGERSLVASGQQTVMCVDRPDQ